MLHGGGEFEHKPLGVAASVCVGLEQEEVGWVGAGFEQVAALKSALEGREGLWVGAVVD